MPVSLQKELQKKNTEDFGEKTQEKG